MWRPALLLALVACLHTASAQGAAHQQRASCQAYSKFLPSIWEDLSAYARDGITEELIQLTWARHNPMLSYPSLKISILNGTVFVAGNATFLMEAAEPWRAGRTPSFFVRFIRELLTYVYVLRDLALTFKLPDVEFVIATNDQPTPATHGVHAWPILRHCKGGSSLSDILIPLFNLYATEDGERPQSVSTRAREAALRRPWKGREGKVVAAYTLYQRAPPEAGGCVEQSRRDADGNVTDNPREALERWAQQTSDPRLLINTMSRQLITEWSQFKYTAHVDGITCSGKLEQTLAQGMLVFREESGYRSFYHRLLRPFVHYVPFWRARPQELLEALAWAEGNDAAAERIAREGQRLVGRFLSRRGLQCFWFHLLTEYATLQRFTPGQVSAPEPGAGSREKQILWDLTPADDWQRELRAAARRAGHEEVAGLTAAVLKLLPGIGPGAKGDAALGKLGAQAAAAGSDGGGGGEGGGAVGSLRGVEAMVAVPEERWDGVRFDDEEDSGGGAGAEREAAGDDDDDLL